MIFVTLYWLATAVVLVAPLLLVLNRNVRWLLLVVVVFPLANVYAAGLGLFSAMLIVIATSNAGAVPLSVTRWFLGWWVLWAVWTGTGFLLDGFDERQGFQALEFIFYGILAAQAVVICHTDQRLFFRMIMSAVLSACVLAIVCIGAAHQALAWPLTLIGRNEAAFVMVVLGILPGLYLLSRPTWLAHVSVSRLVLFAGLTIIVAALMSLQARGATACTIALLAGYGLYWAARRRILLTTTLLLSGVTVVLLVVIQFGLPGGLSDIQSGFSNLERLGLLQASLRLFESRPVLGWGWGSVDSLMPSSPETVLAYPHPHNFLAHFAIELGIGGVLLFVALLVRPVVKAASLARKGFRNEAIWCIAVSLTLVLLGMVDVVLYGASRAIPALLLLAFVEGLPLRSFVFVPATEALPGSRIDDRRFVHVLAARAC